MNNSRPRLASVTKMLVVAIFWVLWCHVDVLSVPQETAECFFFGSDCFFPPRGLSRAHPPQEQHWKNWYRQWEAERRTTTHLDDARAERRVPSHGAIPHTGTPARLRRRVIGRSNSTKARARWTRAMGREAAGGRETARELSTCEHSGVRAAAWPRRATASPERYFPRPEQRTAAQTTGK